MANSCLLTPIVGLQHWIWSWLSKDVNNGDHPRWSVSHVGLWRWFTLRVGGWAHLWRGVPLHRRHDQIEHRTLTRSREKHGPGMRVQHAGRAQDATIHMLMENKARGKRILPDLYSQRARRPIQQPDILLRGWTKYIPHTHARLF